LVRKRGRELRVLKKGWVAGQVDRVLVPWMVVGGGEGLEGGNADPGVMTGAGRVVSREGVTGGGHGSELLDKLSRAEGGQRTGGCRQCLELSLASSPTAGDGGEEGKVVGGDSRRALVEGGGAVRLWEERAVSGEVESEDVEGVCFSLELSDEWSRAEGGQ
jgi:hypothetical protein